MNDIFLISQECFSGLLMDLPRSFFQKVSYERFYLCSFQAYPELFKDVRSGMVGPWQDLQVVPLGGDVPTPEHDGSTPVETIGRAPFHQVLCPFLSKPVSGHLGHCILF